MKPVLLSVVRAAFLTKIGHLQPTQILPFNQAKCDRWWVGKNPLLHYIQYIIVYAFFYAFATTAKGSYDDDKENPTLSYNPTS